MALITRCPGCATAFRVTPLQLQAHGGEVRCGRCAHIFNGFATLTTIQGPEAVDLSNDAIPDRAESPQAPSATDSIIAALADQEESRATASETAQPEAASESPVQETRETQSPVRETPESPESPESGPPAREEPAPQVPHAASAPENGPVEHYIRDDYADNDMDDHGFDAPPSREASPVWGIASLFLLVVLAAQAIYFFRDELSVIAPATRPFLEQYCELLGCTISLPSQRI